MAGYRDFVIEQGATFNKTMILKDGSGTVIDVSEWTGRGQIRKTYRSQETIASFTVDMTYASVGKVSFSLTAEQTAAITAGESETDPRSKYVYDVELYRTVLLVEQVKRVVRGIIYMNPNVTR